MVKPEDVPAACEVLASRKYAPRYALSAGQRANLIRFGCEHPFQRVQAPRQDDVDLHWNLFPPSFPIAFDADALWNRTETVAIGGREFATIGTEVLVLYLCAHGYAHHWGRLEWISALAWLIAARPGVDWAWIRQEAARTGAGRVLELGLVLAGDWMGAPVPAGLLAEARSQPAMGTLLQHVTARILRAPAETAAAESTLNEELFFDLGARENWGRRVSYFLRRLVTPSLEDVEWVSVPGATSRVVLPLAARAFVVSLSESAPDATAMKVLLVSHTCQSRTEGQPKAVCLHRLPGLDLRVLVPDRWRHYGAWRTPDPVEPAQFHLEVGRVALPSLPGAQWYGHWYPGLAKLLREFQPDIVDLWEEPWGLVSAHAVWLRNRLLPRARIVSETEQNVDKTPAAALRAVPPLRLPARGFRGLPQRGSADRGAGEGLPGTDARGA